MITIVLIADTGAAMEEMTGSVSALSGVSIVRHCHGRSPIAPNLARFGPDLGLVDEMGWPRLALERIEEIRKAIPDARVVVRAARPEAGWLAAALRAGACAVVPATAGAKTLGVVLREVVAERELEGHEEPAALAA